MGSPLRGAMQLASAFAIDKSGDLFKEGLGTLAGFSLDTTEFVADLHEDKRCKIFFVLWDI